MLNANCDNELDVEDDAVDEEDAAEFAVAMLKFALMMQKKRQKSL